jgi:hypothetical protein
MVLYFRTDGSAQQGTVLAMSHVSGDRPDHRTL